MPKYPSLTPKQVLSILQKEGFSVDHVTGSHYILYNSITKLRVTLPFHRKELPKGTLHTILKSAGLTKEDLKKYL
jgi:predicted RNA binding protein YcfA (HicA-like mRNA interferase family)